MDIRKRLIAPFAQVSSTDETLRIDLSSFVLRLLLFEKYICASADLKEIPYLINAFGYEGVRALLHSKAMDIQCDLVGMAQGGQVKFLREKRGFYLLAHSPSIPSDMLIVQNLFTNVYKPFIKSKD